MKHFIFTITSGVVLALNVNAQNYEKLYYKDITKETSDITITVDNAVSTAGETKFKLKITNKTNDYILYKPTESKFVINGKEASPSEKMMVIKPNESNFLTINLKGPGYNSVKNYSYTLDGLYTVSTEGKTIPVPNFKLPVTQNEFKAGNFNCQTSDVVKTSGKTEVKFKCSYNGDKAGVIHASRAGVKMPDGKEYANEKKPGLLDSKAKETLVMKGQDESVVLLWEKMEGGKAMDMQKVPMEVIWNATFTEAPVVKVKAETIDFEFDEVKSNAKK